MANHNKRPISAQGLVAVKEQIDHITKVERGKIIAEIQEARAHGDLKENAEYHAAKESQALLEARLGVLNGVLAHAEVIEYDKNRADVVQFSAIVSYVNLDTEQSSTWQILGADEADSNKKVISITSPVARALLGKMVGDTGVIIAPKGKIEVEIVKIEYK
ncbi:MAG: transcription elongation factor GreA [SAR324 cluster bacterium]|nr:transcription elongation factor GreA [SAR324 cluster bacterium]